MSYISIFKTNVNDEKDLVKLNPIFNGVFGKSNWTVALDDEEKILRTSSTQQCAEMVIQILTYLGFDCEELSYN